MKVKAKGIVVTVCMLLGLSSPLGLAGTASGDAGSGIEGVILVTPAMPGPAREGVPESKPLANMTWTVQNEKGAVASFTTDGEGRFRVSLPPGHYTVTRQGRTSGVGHFGPFDVEVAPGKMTTVEWKCDSGIR
jgi:hypothetical protein